MYSSAPGVESITVSLETESATVNYDPSVTDPDTLAGESDWWIVSSSLVSRTGASSLELEKGPSEGS